MSSSDLHAALAAGVTVVTPNNRLARAIVARHDAAMAHAGRRTWNAARALPWNAWLTTLWQDAQDAAAADISRRLLSPPAVHYLWERLVAVRAAGAQPLLDTQGTAALAIEAWELVHAWGAGGESWRAWRDTHEAPPESDPAAFALWAEQYRRELDRLSALDPAQLPDVLATIAANVGGWRDREVVLLGFLETTPQQQRLLAGLTGAGMRIREHHAPTEPGRIARASAPTPREEIRAALAWARRRIEESPDARIGIAIEDLATRRDEIHALAEDALCPALQFSGNAEAPRPYNISLGAPLVHAPVVAAALGFLTLAQGPLPRGEASALVRSRHFPGAWESRARSELTWLQESRREVDWYAALAALERCDAPLATRWRMARDGAPRANTQSPREWVTTWRGMLEASGWPGPGPFAGAQFEARQAFEKLLEEFARIAGVESSLRATSALRALIGLARRTVFQPESPPAAVSILGMLEAAGLEFDALWIAGLTAQRWPPGPRPHSFLPVGWQRERGVPHASAARELAYARLLTDALLRGAPSIVMSHAERIDDHESAASSLIPEAAEALVSPTPPTSAQRIAQARDIIEVADPRAPGLAEGAHRGGAGMIAAQSDCPFRAVARYRLRVDTWPCAAEGLDYRERGQLIHRALAAFWEAVGTHASFVRLDSQALQGTIEAAVAQARSAIHSHRWQRLPRAVEAAEASRVAHLVGTWLDEVERQRGEFAARRIEWSTTLAIAGLTLKLKLDRVDELPSGGYAVIDYKAGNVDMPINWFSARPRAPQVGIYALALEGDQDPKPLRAAVYGKVKAGEVAAVGIAADDVAWPRLTALSRLKSVDGWDGVQTWWREHLTGLAQELRDGLATVTPRDGGMPCRICSLQSLCRIGTTGLVEGDEGDDE